MNCRGTAPPTTLSTNSKPAPRGSGSMVMSHTAYWPCPPLCLTCRPVAGGRRDERLAQGHPQRLGLDRHGVARRAAGPSSTSTWAWPIVHSTTWWVSALCSSRSVGSSATSRCSAPAACPRRTWSPGGSPPAAAARAAPRAPRRRGESLLRQRVGRLGARPAWRPRRGRRRSPPAWAASCRPSGAGQQPDPLVLVVVVVALDLVPGEPARWPETWTAVSGRRVPREHPHEASRPTYASVGGAHHLGDQRAVRVALTAAASARPAGVIAVGSGCIVGGGNAAEIRCSSSPDADAGGGGHRDARGRRCRARPRCSRSAIDGRRARPPRHRGSGRAACRPRTPG